MKRVIGCFYIYSRCSDKLLVPLNVYSIKKKNNAKTPKNVISKIKKKFNVTTATPRLGTKLSAELLSVNNVKLQSYINKESDANQLSGQIRRKFTSCYTIHHIEPERSILVLKTNSSKLRVRFRIFCDPLEVCITFSIFVEFLEIGWKMCRIMTWFIKLLSNSLSFSNFLHLKSEWQFSLLNL